MNIIKPGVNKRVCAFVMDMVLINLLVMLLGTFLDKIMSWVLTSLYILLRDCINGQSIGKSIVGIQVMSIDNQILKPTQTLVRNTLMVIPILPLIEYFVMLKNPEGRRLGDKIANTVVIDLHPERKDMNYLWISIAIYLVFIFLTLALQFQTFAALSQAIPQK